MNETTNLKPPTWFWIVAVMALLWNIMGVGAYLAQVTMSAEALEALAENERAMYENYPAWATSAFAIAVFSGLIASILLLLKKSSAKPLFIVSLIAVLIQSVHTFFISDSVAVYGVQAFIMPALIIIILVYLISFCNKSKANGWIN
jgi:hypothetical protein